LEFFEQDADPNFIKVDLDLDFIRTLVPTVTKFIIMEFDGKISFVQIVFVLPQSGLIVLRVRVMHL